MRSTEENPVFLILIDAFSHSYISKEYTPFISSLFKSGKCVAIDPIFAYRGIEATIFTGTSPNTHKVWTEYYFDNQYKEYLKSRIVRNLIMICEMIPINYLSRVLRYMSNTSMIPVPMLKYFKKSIPHIAAPHCLAVPTLFDILRDNNRTYKILTPSPTMSDQRFFETLDDSLDKEKYDFWFIKFGMLDLKGHEYGPDISKLGELLSNIDSYIKKLYLTFHAKYKNGTFLIISDHGMAEVDATINPKEIFLGIDLKVPEDYVYFIDSTMIRFWFFNETAKKQILSRLSKIKYGKILSDTELEILGINDVGQRYGETIFALRNNLVFFPDFFRLKSPPKGMHGYPFESSKPILILATDSDNKIKNHVRFVDLMPTILELLNLSSSCTCEGESFLEVQ